MSNKTIGVGSIKLVRSKLTKPLSATLFIMGVDMLQN